MKIIITKFLLIFFLLVKFNCLLQAKEYTLLLEQAVITGQGRVPVILYLQHDGSSFISGKAVAPYYAIAGLTYSTGNFRNFDVNISLLTLSGSMIQGTITANITDPNGTNSKSITCNINCTDNNGIIKGEYTGTCATLNTLGGIEGKSQDKINYSGNYRTSILLEYPYPTTFLKDQDHHSMQISFNVSSGIITSAWAQHSQTNTTVYGSAITTTNFDEILEYVSGTGDRAKGFILSDYDLTVVSQTVTITADSIYGDVNIKVMNNTTNVGTFIYKLKCKIIANTLIGAYDVYNGATSIKTNGFCAGHIGSGNFIAMPVFDTISRINYQSGTAFTSPYFNELTQNQWLNKLEAAGIWLYNSPEIGCFHSDFALANVAGSSNKQYDNRSEPGFGGAVSMITLKNVTRDNVLAEKALATAQRAGYYLQSQGWGKYQIKEYYKGMFWETIFSGRAYMELFKATGDKEWLDLAKKYADALKDLQTKMRLYTNGTWTYYDEELDIIGHSNERDDRSYDNRPLQCADYLYFLGSLRVDGGVTDYTNVENEAYSWMKNNLNRPELWIDRRGNWQTVDNNKQAFGPSTFLLYMLKYASTVNASHLDQVIQYVEDNLTNWSHSTSGFTPAVIDYFPRHDWSDSPKANVAASSRMAWVYLLMYKRTGNTVYLNKGKALAYSSLSRQNKLTGMLHHLGVSNYTTDDLVRVNATLNPYYDGHQYSSLKAESILNLYNCYKLLLESGEIQGEDVLAQITVDNDSALLPATINFSGSSSSGISKTYNWDFGDGTSSTAVSPSHIYNNAGTYIVSLSVTSNSITDKTQKTIKVYNTPVIASIKVDTAGVMILKNGIKQFTAKAYDQYERLLIPQPSFTWSVTGSNSVNSLGVVTAQATAGGHVSFTITAQSGIITGTAKFYVVDALPSLGYRYLKVIADKGSSNAHMYNAKWYENGIKWPPVYFTAATNGDMSVSMWGDWTIPYKLYDNIGAGGEIRGGWCTNTLDLSPVYSILPDSVYIEFSTDPVRISPHVWLAASIDNLVWDTLYKQDWPAGVSKQTIILNNTKLGQAISFEAITDKINTDAPFLINAVASSGLPVSFSIVSGPAIVSGNTVTLNGAIGTVIVRASQNGNSFYNTASPVERSFNVDLPTVSNTMKETNKIKVFPTLNNGIVFIEGNTSNKINIISLTGKITIQKIDNGILNIQNIPSGLYILEIDNTFIKIIKQ